MAKSFRYRDIGSVMDPLVMVDHYVMTEPTFGAHPHAGMSAVSVLFEDSQGLFHNKDSLGNDFDLKPGDLYWLSAGNGAVHDEAPRGDARIHGLQLFVNVPQAQRFEKPTSKLVRVEDMPVIETEGYRVKVAIGESNSVRSATSPSTPFTLLDGIIQTEARFLHQTGANHGVWVLLVDGSIHVEVTADMDIDKSIRHLESGQAVAITPQENVTVSISNPSTEPAHFVLIDGNRIAETFVHEGTFVMGSQHQIERVKANYKAGKFDSIAPLR